MTGATVHRMRPLVPRKWLRRIAATSIALASLTPLSAPAQPAAAPPPPVLVPPTLEVPPEVAYPEGAEGDAEVILVLVVERDGRVRSATALSGAEPFASAATEAALGFVFTPGAKDGEPVVAKIRFAVTFTAPRVIEPEDPAAEEVYLSPPLEGTAPPHGPPPPPQAIEVTVVGQKTPPSAKTMSRAEVRQLPGAFGDPFRAIEIMPGVTPIVSGLPYFYVRGAPPGNVGYYLDGVRVPYLFHVAAGPSVIHPGLVDRVDLYSGGYPARFGRFSGAIVAAETTPPIPEWHGEGNVRLVDVGALVEAPFDNYRGSALVAGRYSYTAAVISLISPDIRLDYRDYQARVSYALSPRDRITLFAFGSYDLLAQEQNDIETVLFGSEFYRADLRYDITLPDDAKMRWATTLGFDQTRVADQRNAQDVLWGARVELTHPVGKKATARGGLDLLFDGYKADGATYGDKEDPDVEAYNRLFPSRTDSVATAWADVVWQPDKRIEVTPGLRADLFHSGGASAVGLDPRLGVQVDVTDRVRLLHAVGLAHQPPSFIVPIPGLAIANLTGGLQTSVQTSAGVEVDLPWKTTAAVTLFQSLFLNMTDTAGVNPPGDDQNQVPRSLGVGRGLEVYVRRNLTSELGGFVSYTLSRSTRSLAGYEFPFAFDRTHVLHTALSYDIGRGWRAGGRFTYYTGVPNLEAPSGQSETTQLTTFLREPDFYRFDFRVEKKWTLGETTWLALVIEMLNATLHKETVRGNEIGPVSIPSIGLEGGF